MEVMRYAQFPTDLGTRVRDVVSYFHLLYSNKTVAFVPSTSHGRWPRAVTNLFSLQKCIDYYYTPTFPELVQAHAGWAQTAVTAEFE